MEKLQFKTNNLSSPQGKPHVYFCCHPEDHSELLESISDELLLHQDCAVWYLSDPACVRTQDIWDDLSQMQLFVMPVTRKLLTCPNPALDSEFPFARAHNIPVLPLLQDDPNPTELVSLFNEKCGELQFLNKYAHDSTALSYDEKLKTYLSSVLVSNELAQKIRMAFDAYVFLSYRKKDRRFAQELMALIHRHEFCRDIAIWYDEYLTPGENFNDAIRAALEKSDLFVLAVTPNLVNEDNYVRNHEYPAACELKKPILPVEFSPTDRAQLASQYPDIPTCTDIRDSAALATLLRDATRSIALRGNNDPRHTFFIGLAYLSGIDVEVNFERALELITSAAEAGLTAAADKLVTMYGNGQGVAWDTEKMLFWQNKLIDYRRRDYRSEPTLENGLSLLTELRAMADVEEAKGNADGQSKLLAESFQLASELNKRFPCASVTQHLAASLSLVGSMYQNAGDLNKAHEFYGESETLLRDQLRREGVQLLNEAPFITLPHDDMDGTVMILLSDLCVVLSNSGDVLLSMGEESGNTPLMERADRLHKLAYEYLVSDALRCHCPNRMEHLSAVISRLGHMEARKGNTAAAREWFLHAVALDEGRLALAGRNHDPLAMEAYALGCYDIATVDSRHISEGYLQQAASCYRQLADLVPQFPHYSERAAYMEDLLKQVKGYNRQLAIARGEDPDSTQAKLKNMFTTFQTDAFAHDASRRKELFAQEQQHQRSTLERLEKRRQAKAAAAKAAQAEQLYRDALSQLAAGKQEEGLALLERSARLGKAEAEQALSRYRPTTKQSSAQPSRDDIADRCYREAWQRFRQHPEGDREALALLQKCMEQDALCSDRAIYYLGICMEKGIGTAADPVRAFRLYKAGHELGSMEATYRLARCYQYGIGVAKTPHIAVRYYTECFRYGMEQARRKLMLLSPLNHLQHLSRYEKARKNYQGRSLWLAETGIAVLDKLVENE